MSKEQICEALLKIGHALEQLPASEQQTKCAIMISDLRSLIETDGKYPNPASV